MPPELAALDAQFQALQKERVLLPYEQNVAELNKGYLAGLDKAISAEKATGNLDGTLVLNTEKQTFGEKKSVPQTDEASSPPSLKRLRDTYRS